MRVLSFRRRGGGGVGLVVVVVMGIVRVNEELITELWREEEDHRTEKEGKIKSVLGVNVRYGLGWEEGDW